MFIRYRWALHEQKVYTWPNMKFTFRYSLVNMNKSVDNKGLLVFTKQTLNASTIMFSHIKTTNWF